jgi:hypothetical protein
MSATISLHRGSVAAHYFCMHRIALSLLACAACAYENGGMPEPIATGSFDGYEVVSPCNDAQVLLGVIGRGSNKVPTEQVIDHGRALFATFTDLSSVWGGGGLAAGCQEGHATTLSLDDRRYVKELVIRTAAFLRERDLALEVVIDVAQAPKEL